MRFLTFFVLVLSSIPMAARVAASTPNTGGLHSSGRLKSNGQGLKLDGLCGFYCTAEAAPFQSPVSATGSSSENTPASSAPAAKPVTSVLPPEVKDSDIGFSYSLPEEWEALASQLPTADIPYPTVVGPKKGNACAQVELTARHGSPYSVIVVVALPFDCYGETLTDKNFSDFASGTAEGLKQTFDIANAEVTNYSLGNHKIWIERANGTVKGQPDSKYTLETACTLMQKGAACWWTMAADAAHLKTFEESKVKLEGDAFDSLVPAGTVKAAAGN